MNYVILEEKRWLSVLIWDNYNIFIYTLFVVGGFGFVFPGGFVMCKTSVSFNHIYLYTSQLLLLL